MTHDRITRPYAGWTCSLHFYAVFNYIMHLTDIASENQIEPDNAIKFGLIKQKSPSIGGGSAKRDDIHPRVIVVQNACFYLFRKRLCTPMRLEHDSSTKIAFNVTRRRRQAHLSPVFGGH